MFPCVETSAAVFVLAEPGDQEAIRRRLAGLLFLSYIEGVHFLTPVAGVPRIDQQQSHYKRHFVPVLPRACYVIICLQSSKKAVTYERWTQRMGLPCQRVSSPDQAVREVVAHSPESMRYTHWKKELEPIPNRSALDPVAWLGQFDQLGCREVGEHLLYSIVVVPTQMVFRRVLLTRREHDTYGERACYVVIESGTVDSDGALFWQLARLKQPVVRLFERDEIANQFPSMPPDTGDAIDTNPLAKYVRQLDEEIARRADVLVLVDECNFTGEKLLTSQMPRLRDFAKLLGKPYLAKFAYSTTCGRPENSQYRYRLETMPDVRGRFVVHDEDNLIANVSPEQPMAFRHVADGEKRLKLLHTCASLGKSLRATAPLGFGSMAGTLLFSNVIPDNTVPLLTVAGRIENDIAAIDWRPLIDA